MKTIYNVQSNCCKSPILWNITTNDKKKGICTKCKEWAEVIKISGVNV